MMKGGLLTESRGWYERGFVVEPECPSVLVPFSGRSSQRSCENEQRLKEWLFVSGLPGTIFHWSLMLLS